MTIIRDWQPHWYAQNDYCSSSLALSFFPISFLRCEWHSFAPDFQTSFPRKPLPNAESTSWRRTEKLFVKFPNACMYNCTLLAEGDSQLRFFPVVTNSQINTQSKNLFKYFPISNLFKLSLCEIFMCIKFFNVMFLKSVTVCFSSKFGKHFKCQLLFAWTYDFSCITSKLGKVLKIVIRVRIGQIHSLEIGRQIPKRVYMEGQWNFGSFPMFD